MATQINECMKHLLCVMTRHTPTHSHTHLCVNSYSNSWHVVEDLHGLGRSLLRTALRQQLVPGCTRYLLAHVVREQCHDDVGNTIQLVERVHHQNLLQMLGGYVASVVWYLQDPDDRFTVVLSRTNTTRIWWYSLVHTHRHTLYYLSDVLSHNTHTLTSGCLQIIVKSFGNHEKHPSVSSCPHRKIPKDFEMSISPLYNSGCYGNHAF